MAASTCMRVSVTASVNELHRDGKLALHRAQRGARRLDRAAVDQIGDRFGLGQVELVVEESAAGELARLGHASTELQCCARAACP